MVSDVSGAGSDSYTSLGGLFRVRLQQSKDPRLQSIAKRLSVADSAASALNDIINPKGFVGIDGKMKFIPGISFSDNSGIFKAIQQQGEISEERLKRQIDHYAAKRKEKEAFEARRKARRDSINQANSKAHDIRKKQTDARIAAFDVYLEKAFGINKKKTAYSPYNNRNRATDLQIFGRRSGTVDYNSYNIRTNLTIDVAKSISFDWLDGGAQTTQEIKISDYVKKKPPTGDIVVRLLGNGEIIKDTATKRVANGARVPSPTGKLYYTNAAGNRVDITGSAVTKLTQSEFDTLMYVSDFTNRKTRILSKDGAGNQTATDVLVQDFLAVTAVDESNPANLQRGHINKIAITKGKLDRKPSPATDTQVYHAKMYTPRHSIFNKVTMNVEGTFAGDGSASNNAADGTILDLINEGKISVFAREIGYTTRVFLDVANSKDNTLVFKKRDNDTRFLGDGIEIFFEIPAAHRANVDIRSLSFGDIS